MYAAFYIQPLAPESKRVVICKPFVAKLMTAWAVLRSAKRADTTGGVLAGPQKTIEECIKQIDETEATFPQDPFQTINKINAIANACGCKILFPQNDTYGTATMLSHLMATIGQNPITKHKLEQIILATKVVPPSPGEYPRMINPKAKKAWDFITEEYATKINSFKDQPVKQWAVAVIIFKRACAAAGVMPFIDKSEEWFLKSAKEIEKRLNSGNRRADAEVEAVCKRLVKDGLVISYTTDKFFEVAKVRGRFYITSFRSLLLPKQVDVKDLFYRMKAEHTYTVGNAKGVRYAHKHIDSYTDVLIEEQDTPGRLHAYVTNYMTREQALILLGLATEDDSVTTDSLITDKLNAVAVHWFDTGRLIDAMTVTNQHGTSITASDNWRLLHEIAGFNQQITTPIALMITTSVARTIFIPNSHLKNEAEALAAYSNHIGSHSDNEITEVKVLDLRRKPTVAGAQSTSADAAVVIENWLRSIDAQDIKVYKHGDLQYKWLLQGQVSQSVYCAQKWEIRVMGGTTQIGVFNVDPHYEILSGPISDKILQATYEKLCGQMNIATTTTTTNKSGNRPVEVNVTVKVT